MTAVYQAWEQYDHTRIEKAFCTLMTNYDQIICHEGGNCYKTVHLGKDAIWDQEGVHALREHAAEASPEALHMYDTFFGDENNV